MRAQETERCRPLLQTKRRRTFRVGSFVILRMSLLTAAIQPLNCGELMTAAIASSCSPVWFFGPRGHENIRLSTIRENSGACGYSSLVRDAISFSKSSFHGARASNSSEAKPIVYACTLVLVDIGIGFDIGTLSGCCGGKLFESCRERFGGGSAEDDEADGLGACGLR